MEVASAGLVAVITTLETDGAVACWANAIAPGA